METVKGLLLGDRHRKPIATDIHFNETAPGRPVIIYAHGFNGFKDWGNFDLTAAAFVAAGFTLVKFNFAFNGTTPETPEDFSDLEAFAENNYTKELDNLAAVIEWTCSTANPYARYINVDKLALCGHSMGGGIVLIKAAEDARVKAVVTWAAVFECKTPWGKWPASRIDEWRRQGVVYIENGRTHQQMPLGFQLYEDYRENAGRLSIEAAVSKLQVPLLIVHGTTDTSVAPESAHRIKKWQPAAELFLLDTDHTFGRRHPWTEPALPGAMQAVVNETIRFLKEAL